MCLCPSGFYGYECDTQEYKQCYVNITNPPFYQGCDYPDSAYYMYSIHGYDPCYFLDFTKSYDVRFILNCQNIALTGIEDDSGEKVGYEYRDVVSTDPFPTLTYSYVNAENGVKVNVNDSLLVTIDIRDMKWLSSYARFSTNVTDPLILVGINEGVI